MNNINVYLGRQRKGVSSTKSTHFAVVFVFFLFQKTSGKLSPSPMLKIPVLGQTVQVKSSTLLFVK